ncbi:fimbrial biogenesis chaperone [Acinetobacter rudis]|uniref:Molecular chaperone n=1 Tax=Acinetobacter rudis TaxID=632955 RepID=A0AAW8J919_9GAMM|nr:molecular chaperone [Acinetobacter rudis]MDQ8936245.1 molecular chaperone [Acinetobacter rudis]MDQ8953959.1 molecular chaperone [Acinetobacter rudis]MDQ9018508.1 molecular chaperone [Acinetobacter rudis]
MYLRTIATSVFLASTFFLSQSYAAIQAQASRVIYDASAKAATLSLKNNTDKPYMVQSWLEAGKTTNEDQKIPFVVTPPLVKIEPQKESTLRFIYSGTGLATDQESQFWINIQEIPPKPENENVLQLAVRTKIKLFYRPKQINIQLEDAIKQVHWSVQGNALKLENKSPLFITIGDLKLGDQTGKLVQMDEDMIPPFQSTIILKHLPTNTKTISFTYLNEFGGNVQMPPVQLY